MGNLISLKQSGSPNKIIYISRNTTATPPSPVFELGKKRLQTERGDKDDNFGGKSEFKRNTIKAVIVSLIPHFLFDGILLTVEGGPAEKGEKIRYVH